MVLSETDTTGRLGRTFYRISKITVGLIALRVKTEAEDVAVTDL